MTPEEINRTIEFILQQSAQFSVQMGQLSDRMDQISGHMGQLSVHMDQLSGHVDQVSGHVDQIAFGLTDLRHSTARFESWAAEVMAMHSTRLDRQDQFHRIALLLLQRILDKMPSVN